MDEGWRNWRTVDITEDIFPDGSDIDIELDIKDHDLMITTYSAHDGSRFCALPIMKLVEAFKKYGVLPPHNGASTSVDADE